MSLWDQSSSKRSVDIESLRRRFKRDYKRRLVMSVNRGVPPDFNTMDRHDYYIYRHDYYIYIYITNIDIGTNLKEVSYNLNIKK